MARIHTTRVKSESAMQKADAKLKAGGYTPLLRSFGSNQLKGNTKYYEDFISGKLSGGEQSGKDQRQSAPLLYASSGNEIKDTGAAECGTPGLGYIEWGAGNVLPNVVALLTDMLPYTAAGWDFNTKLAASLGPEALYSYTQYVGGNITKKQIPFKDAGVLLRGQIRDLKRQISNAIDEDGKSTLSDSLRKDIEDEIKELEENYSKWEATNKELETFLHRNNLAEIFLNLTADQTMFGINFPELQLNQQEIDPKTRKPKNTANWEPKITGIAHRPAITCRLERMDGRNRINFVYCSNQWYDKSYVDSNGPKEIVAYPALSPSTPTKDLEEAVLTARSKNVSVADRPTRFIMPSQFPTVGRPYYPHPSWHSIFGGDIYEYAYTIISDRVTRKKNANVIGRIIYIYQPYLERIFQQEGIKGPEEKKDRTNKLLDEINDWLSNRSNSGQGLMALTMMGTDGKEHKSVEIVELVNNSSDNVAANQKELAEVNSIITMAMGLDTRLLGSSPLDVAGLSGGGTDLRERYLLKQIQMAPVQRILLTPLNVIRDFNEWDPHLTWAFKREVLTTLDNSKTGITEQE